MCRAREGEEGSRRNHVPTEGATLASGAGGAVGPVCVSPPSPSHQPGPREIPTLIPTAGSFGIAGPGGGGAGLRGAGLRFGLGGVRPCMQGERGNDPPAHPPPPRGCRSRPWRAGTPGGGGGGRQGGGAEEHVPGRGTAGAGSTGRGGCLSPAPCPAALHKSVGPAGSRHRVNT